MADEPSEVLPKLTVALEGRYTIERELGRGGMATVFLAHDVKHGREVAIKVLHPELAVTVGGGRFEREIRLLARLQHPHILGMFDSGEADGLLYYVMPFVKGESLRDRIEREGMLPIEDAIQIALEVNDALGYAHKQGIVHRDIKPENILLTGGHALVADFGIAKLAEDQGGQKLTQTGMSMGTPYYMAPEQSSGEPAGPTSDIYALGCVLYEMLAGEPPFTGKNAMQIMARHAMEQVPSVRIVRNVVPEDIENAIYIAMNKSPADRPQSAEQFAQLLGLPMGSTASMRVLTPTMQRRIPSGAQGAIAQMQRPWWKRPVALAGGAVVVLAAAGAAWIFGRGGRPSVVNAGPDARRIAVLYFDDASKDHTLGPVADGLTEGLITSLSGASSFTVISANGAARFRGSNAPPDSVARAVRVGYLVRGSVEPEGDKLRIGVRLDDASGVNLTRASLTVPAASVVSARDTVATVVADLIKRGLHEQFEVAGSRASTTSTDAWLLLQRGEAARKAMDAAAAARDSAGIDRAYETADSLYAAAEAADRSWSDPEARRALIAYRRSRFASDATGVRHWVGVGLEHANKALALDANNPDALETRGNLKYWSWLQNLEVNPAKKVALIESARDDLVKATTLNRNQAGAYATLSHLYNNIPGGSETDVVLAAQQAYAADEFLAEADRVLNSLFLAAYDRGEFDKARQWCGETRLRFPGGARSLRCQLYLLTMPGAKPDVAAAWRLADSVVGASPPNPYVRLNSDMIVAMVVARAAKDGAVPTDSAKRLIERSLGDPSVDKTRDLAYLGAMAYTALGDPADAVRLLKIHLAANPQKLAGLRTDPGWQLRALTSDPAYRQLVGRGN